MANSSPEKIENDDFATPSRLVHVLTAALTIAAFLGVTRFWDDLMTTAPQQFSTVASASKKTDSRLETALAEMLSDLAAKGTNITMKVN